MIEIIIATRNSSKLVQIRELLRGTSVELKTLKDIGVPDSVVVEEDRSDSATLESNSFTKAMFGHEHSDKTRWTLADDTGLFIRALGGAPGVHAATWGGDGLTVEQRMNFCIEQMSGRTDRRATFRTVVAAISPTGERHFFDGKVDGVLLDAPSTLPQPGMPYSSLFMPNGDSRTWAGMSTAEENEISHRGIAFRRAVAFLRSQA